MLLSNKLWVLCACLLLIACNEEETQQSDAATAEEYGENTFGSFVDTARGLSRSQPQLPGKLTASKTVLAFDAAPLHKVTEDMELKNAGEKAISFTSLAVATHEDAFSLEGDCISITSLAPGASCKLFVSFQPETHGGHDTKLLIAHTGGNNPFLVPIEASTPDKPRIVGNTSEEIQIPRKPLQIRYGKMSNHPTYPVAVTEGSYHLERERIIPANRYISAVLETTLLSEKGGRIMSIADRPIYAGQGQDILLPQGSRFIGSYQAIQSGGETRLAVIWERVDTPGNQVILLDKAPSADLMGRNALPGHIDHRFMEKYSIALATSFINIAGVAAAGDTQVTTSEGGSFSESRTARQQAIDQFSEDLSHIAKDWLDTRSDIRPIITIPAGTLITIIPVSDIYVPDQDVAIAYTPAKTVEAREAYIEAQEKEEEKEKQQEKQDKPKAEDSRSVQRYYGGSR